MYFLVISWLAIQLQVDAADHDLRFLILLIFLDLAFVWLVSAEGNLITIITRLLITHIADEKVRTKLFLVF